MSPNIRRAFLAVDKEKPDIAKKALTCITVMHSDALMATVSKKPRAKREKKTPRITVSLSNDSYEQVVRIAQSKKVSASWIVRDAVEKYLAGDLPLFTQRR